MVNLASISLPFPVLPYSPCYQNQISLNSLETQLLSLTLHPMLLLMDSTINSPFCSNTTSVSLWLQTDSHLFSTLCYLPSWHSRYFSFISCFADAQACICSIIWTCPFNFTFWLFHHLRNPSILLMNYNDQHLLTLLISILPLAFPISQQVSSVLS